MAKYKVECKEFHNLVKEKFEIFDTKDKKRWQYLRNVAIKHYGCSESEYSKTPSDDPEIWLELYQIIGADYFDEKYETRWNEYSNGDFEVEYNLFDENDNLIE